MNRTVRKSKRLPGKKSTRTHYRAMYCLAIFSKSVLHLSFCFFTVVKKQKNKSLTNLHSANKDWLTVSCRAARARLKLAILAVN